MEHVDIGNMLPGGIPVNDMNVNPTWKAHIQTHEGIKVAYVKQLNARALYVECVCALIGRCLGMPIPKPMIIRINKEAMPAIPDGEFSLGFGSEDADYPSFRRFINSDSEDAMRRLQEFAKTLNNCA